MTKKVSLKEQQIEQHQYILSCLEICMNKLMQADLDEMEEQDYKKWKSHVDNIREARRHLRQAILTSINSEYANLLPQFELATSSLEAEIENMQSANDIIIVASAVTGTLTSIISLFD